MIALSDNPSISRKLEIGLAKGKKIYDKRETIAKKDAERRMRQVVMRDR